MKPGDQVVLVIGAGRALGAAIAAAFVCEGGGCQAIDYCLALAEGLLAPPRNLNLWVRYVRSRSKAETPGRAS
jgi:NAD(P)-dependent dehydrogenase (short-subunit alcohol dehydrogenase family)